MRIHSRATGRLGHPEDAPAANHSARSTNALVPPLRAEAGILPRLVPLTARNRVGTRPDTIAEPEDQSPPSAMRYLYLIEKVFSQPCQPSGTRQVNEPESPLASNPKKQRHKAMVDTLAPGLPSALFCSKIGCPRISLVCGAILPLFEAAWLQLPMRDARLLFWFGRLNAPDGQRLVPCVLHVGPGRQPPTCPAPAGAA